jgi:hypothetical protein
VLHVDHEPRCGSLGLRGGPGITTCRIASNGVYFLVVTAPLQVWFAVLPKYFTGK